MQDFGAQVDARIREYVRSTEFRATLLDAQKTLFKPRVVTSIQELQKAKETATEGDQIILQSVSGKTLYRYTAGTPSTVHGFSSSVSGWETVGGFRLTLGIGPNAVASYAGATLGTLAYDANKTLFVFWASSWYAAAAGQVNGTDLKIGGTVAASNRLYMNQALVHTTGPATLVTFGPGAFNGGVSGNLTVTAGSVGANFSADTNDVMTAWIGEVG